jgi:hypothetical protein
MIINYDDERGSGRIDTFAENKQQVNKLILNHS